MIQQQISQYPFFQTAVNQGGMTLPQLPQVAPAAPPQLLQAQQEQQGDKGGGSSKIMDLIKQFMSAGGSAAGAGSAGAGDAAMIFA